MQDKGYIKNLLSDFMTVYSDKFAFSLYDGVEVRDVTYMQFAEDVLKMAGFFQTKKFFNQHIALIDQNSYEWIVAFFAILASGNVAVMMNPALPKDILEWQVEKADVSMLCCSSLMKEELMKKDITTPVVTFDQRKENISLLFDEVHIERLDETKILMFTSGTTGKSKVVEHTLNNLKCSVEYIGDMFNDDTMERMMSLCPLYHIAGLHSVVAALENGKIQCIGRGLRYWIMDIPKLNPTNIGIVPVIAENIVKFLKKTSTDEEKHKIIGSNLKKISIGGASWKESTAKYLLDLGFTLEIIYAMTETAGGGMWGAIDIEHCNSISKLREGMHCKIVDGEILLKGSAIMKGYYKDPEETAKVLKDGWLHTGDLGYRDEDGYYYLTGRKKNVIILSNGENVNPEEIEAKLANCEAVVESMVYSNGKGICADIYTQDEAAVAEYVKAYNEGVPLYRQVYKVFYYGEPLERTGTGKIKRKENL